MALTQISKPNNHNSQLLSKKKKKSFCLLWKFGSILFYRHLALFTVLYKCLYIHSEVWDKFGYSFECRLYPQRPRQRKTFKLSFSSETKCVVSEYRPSHAAGHWVSSSVGKPETSAQRNSESAWCFSSGDLELQGCSFIDVLNGGPVITAATASVAQLPTLYNDLWKEYINYVKSWFWPSVTERAALERLRFAFLQSSESHGRC